MKFTNHFKNSLVLICLIFFVNKSFGQSLKGKSESELIAIQYIEESHADLFAHLAVQGMEGRLKPVHTLSLEILRKIYKKDKYTYFDNNQKKSLNATQVFLGMQLNPGVWQLLPLIKIDKEAQTILGKSFRINKEGYTKPAYFIDFQGNYVLKSFVDEANAKLDRSKTAFDKAILKIDERFNIFYNTIIKSYLTIFPDYSTVNNKWNSPLTDSVSFNLANAYFSSVNLSIQTKDWSKSNEILNHLKEYQQKNVKEEVSYKRLSWEVIYNKSKLFFFSMISYATFGPILLILCFLILFYEFKWLKIVAYAFISLIFLTFLTHLFGFALRWYVSGHAPWSDGYEATIFISWVSLLVGFIFIKKSFFPLAGMSLISVCLLGLAHGNLMNPQLTNLVPVLKSYWLRVHVETITASYAVLILGSVLSFICFILFILLSNDRKEKIFKTVHQLTAINEVATTVGLFMLTIGTFLGGVWANESWGRYWGWDPKETWALISVIIYSFLLHFRIISPKKSLFTYNVISLFSISTLIMTYFGVNYYLAGLHSYAKGDSFPIPSWIMPTILILISFVIISYFRYLKFSKR